tara:strand:- start:274 stop:438 length:165 start_codon:yes stop_codon:yes gene_type:complete
MMWEKHIGMAIITVQQMTIRAFEEPQHWLIDVTQAHQVVRWAAAERVEALESNK